MAKVVNLTSTNNGVFELFAVWTDQNVYQVKFNANGGAGFMNNQPFASVCSFDLMSFQPVG